MEQHLAEIVAALPGRVVLVVGDVMLDEYIWGDVRRISPEAPVPVVAVRRRSCMAGGAANAAVNVASLDGQVLLAGVVGADLAATRLGDALRSSGLSAEGLLVDPDRVTTTKTRIIAHSQQVVRIDEEHPQPLSPEVENRLFAWVERHMSRVHACILSDYGKGLVSPRLAQHLIGLARAAGRPIIVDPKGTDYAKYRGATVVKPNIHEAEEASKPHVRPSAPLPEIGHHLLNLLQGSALLLTRGAEGMCLFEPGKAPLQIPSVARAVFDVTGAGDTVASTLALALATGAPLEHAAQLANQAAGIVVGKVGTARATRRELLG